MPLPFCPRTQKPIHSGKGGYFGVLWSLLLFTNSFVNILKYRLGNKAVISTAFSELGAPKSEQRQC